MFLSSFLLELASIFLSQSQCLVFIDGSRGGSASRPLGSGVSGCLHGPRNVAPCTHASSMLPGLVKEMVARFSLAENRRFWPFSGADRLLILSLQLVARYTDSKSTQVKTHAAIGTRDGSAQTVGAHCAVVRSRLRVSPSRCPPVTTSGQSLHLLCSCSTGGPNFSCLVDLSLLPRETNIAKPNGRRPAKKCRGSLRLIRLHMRRGLSHRRGTITLNRLVGIARTQSSCGTPRGELNVEARALHSIPEHIPDIIMVEFA